MGTLTRQKKIIKRVRNYVMITVAAFIYAISISLFLDPNNIAPGGITGVAILINRFTNIPTGTLNLILNVPIVLLGLLKFGPKFIASTFYALAAITVFTNYLTPFGAVTQAPADRICDWWCVTCHISCHDFQGGGYYRWLRHS